MRFEGASRGLVAWCFAFSAGFAFSVLSLALKIAWALVTNLRIGVAGLQWTLVGVIEASIPLL